MMKKQKDFILAMNLRHKLWLFVLLFFASCSKETDLRISNSSFIKNLSLTSYDSNIVKWKISCHNAELYEEKNTVKCYNADIITYSDGMISSEMKADFGYADVAGKKFFLKGNAKIFSPIQNTTVITEEIHFNYEKSKIYSDKKTFIFKNNIKIDSEGFEAKADLSNIKIKKHKTVVE